MRKAQGNCRSASWLVLNLFFGEALLRMRLCGRNRIPRTLLHWAPTLAFVASLLAPALCGAPAQAQTFTVLYSLTGSDGETPLSALSLCR